MKKKLFIIATLSGFIFFCIPNANAQWVQMHLASAVAQISAFASIGPDGPSPILFASYYSESPSSIFVSTDDGTQWTGSGLDNTEIFCLAVSGANTSSPMLFAGAVAEPSFPSFAPGGVYLSTNKGASWAPVNNGLTDSNTSVYSLQTMGTNIFAGIGGAVYISRNNGANWTEVSNGLSGIWNGALFFPLVTCFTVSNTPTPMLFAGTALGIYRTSNNGAEWQHAMTGFPDTDVTIYTVDASGPNLLAGSYTNGVFLSTNNGATWRAANDGGTNIASAAVFAFANSGSNVFAATDSGIYISKDNGASWAMRDTGLNSATSNSVVGVDITALTVLGPNLYAGTYTGAWRRSLSDYGISAVSTVAPVENSLRSYPNPFTASTTIDFSASQSGLADVSIVNIMGTEVTHIFSGTLEAGEHEYSWDARGFAPGMYECMVKMNGRVQSVPIVLE